ncbi:MAG TPA: DNA-binding domain-containing protein [Methylomirabilota bacterium]|nr:DNA-binding domain-containing protein [Methylomirabilota bacterium]
MTSLRELQRDVRRALLGRGDSAATPWVASDGLEAPARLAIYRHHVLTTLTAALQATFPVVCRLVHERFFAYAADRYIRREPPSGPCLFEYGATFPAFLATFPACRSLPYLGDVARLEWALNHALHAPDHVPLDLGALQARTGEVTGESVLGLDPSLSLVASRWPIDRIWHANQPGADTGATVELGAGRAWLEVRRVGEVVGFRNLEAATFAFRRTLAEGRRLGEAVDQAVAADGNFDLAGALGALVREGLLGSIARPA